MLRKPFSAIVKSVFGRKPHRSGAFTLSADPLFVAKIQYGVNFGVNFFDTALAPQRRYQRIVRRSGNHS